MPEKNNESQKAPSKTFAGVSLDTLSCEQWEELCARCGVCCAHKLEDAETGEVIYLDEMCSLFDPATRSCTAYANRAQLMPDCAHLTPEKVREFYWLPTCCAYKIKQQEEEQSPFPEQC